jgi:putative PIN family toxin of toxin-antitoxin system
VGALVVLDTNIVLDLFVFADARSRALREHLERGAVQWLSTAAMREELARVLGYAHIASRLAFYRLEAAGVLALFDRHARTVATADKAPVTCADPDDQKFIDLAVAHRCMLLSKDAAVLTLKNKLAALRVEVGAVIPAQLS